jgi:glycosyltransferase involved in cell wall biosynthesis
MGTVLSVFGVEPSRIGGTETFARELSSQLGERGWKSVLCFETAPSEEVASFLDRPNVTLEVLPDLTNFTWSATQKLAGLIRRHKPDILHLHFIGFVGAVPWLARIFSVSKIFFTDHSSRPANYAPSRAPLWKRTLVRAINYPMTKVICVSQYGLRCMTALDVLPRDRFELVYNAVDLSRVERDSSRAAAFRHRFSIPDKKRIVLQVSWIIPEKGIGDLLEVAQLVHSQTNDVQFVIAGEGPSRQQYMKQAQEMGLGETITWTGLVKDPFQEGLFDAADVVCQLSRWEEVFGWMIAEAMAYGKPVVATRVGGIPELVDDGETGFLIERGNAKEASERILRLSEDRELREDLGHAGRLKTESRFSLTTNVAELLEVYGI